MKLTWAGRVVPPPTVPTSMDGIEHDMYKSLPSFTLRHQILLNRLGTYASRIVIQFDDSTFCAGSCPHAK
jgi:hypothetical protein